MPDFTGDLEVLACLDDKGTHGRPRLGHVGIERRIHVRGWIDRYAEESEPGRRACPDRRRALADAAREDEDVDAVERCGHRGDACTEPVKVDLHREVGYAPGSAMAVYAAATELTDADIVLGEGRQIVFVEPGAARRLDLGGSAGRVVPAFLDSDHYRRLCP